jgi:hypothetical protein
MKFIQAFKSVFAHLNSLGKDDLTKLMNACHDDDIAEVKKLFEKKKFRILRIDPLPVQSIFTIISMNGSINVMDYLLTSENAKDFQTADVSLESSLQYASLHNQKELLIYLLTLPDTIKTYIPKNKEDIVLDYLSQLLHFDTIEFFINSPLFKDKINLHTNDDILFIQCYNNRKDKFLEYLLLERNLEKTSCINDFLNNLNLHNQNDPYLNRIKNMFDIRDLHKDLNNELKPNVADKQKKIKI